MNTEQPVQNGLEKDSDFLEVTQLFYQLQAYKAQRYGDSWCKHGEAISVFGNTSRKYDRLQNMVIAKVEAGFDYPDPESEETVAETVGDLGIYSILWMTYIKKNRPEEYKAWKSRIQGQKNFSATNFAQDLHPLALHVREFLQEVKRRFPWVTRSELLESMSLVLRENVL